MAARILIADDHKITRGRLSEVLADRGPWEVCGLAENGQQAVEKAAELKPSLIILDLAMPVMDGLNAAREIGKILPSVPIVLFTLHKLPLVELEAKKAGVRHVVEKNGTHELLSVVKKLIQEVLVESDPSKKQLLLSASGPQDPMSAASIPIQHNVSPAASADDLDSSSQRNRPAEPDHSNGR